jgi:CheY-like chemotaxis protein
VLIVEDDRMTRATMRKMLEGQGCRVTEAENGEAALAAMEVDRPSLIFLDLMMPVMDGFEFAEKARTNPAWRAIPIVVVTATDLTGPERRRLNGWVETILQKEGSSREELLQQVKDALDENGVPRSMTA